MVPCFRYCHGFISPYSHEHDNDVPVTLRILQFPWSQHPLGHARYNLLIDPWFEGTQIDFFPWFSRQSHAVSPIVTSIADLNNYLADVENSIQQRSSLPTNAEPDTKAKSRNPYIDAIMISHEFTDHCNEHTLREVDANTPIVATKAAAKVIRSWCHFKNVQEISNFAAISHDSAKSLSVSLPSWLWFSRLVSNLDIGYLHSAVMICFSLQQKQSQPTRAAEAIIYTPHGIHADKISQIAHATPSIQPLALIHGLHEVFVCRVGQINLGAVNGLEVQKSSGARYWISTHDVR